MLAPVTSEKISMTAPLLEEQAGEHVFRVSFAMPSKFTLENASRATRQRITFKVIESRRTLRYDSQGECTRSSRTRKTEELRTCLSKNGLTPKSNFVVALYNPPFIPGIFRRNEVIVDI